MSEPTCPTCGAPVNLAPDGDPKYEALESRASIRKQLRDEIKVTLARLGFEFDDDTPYRWMVERKEVMRVLDEAVP